MHHNRITVSDPQHTQKGQTRGEHSFRKNGISKEDGAENGQLEKLFGEVVESSFFRQAVRHDKIRLENWVQALSKPEFNRTWHSNKLKYLKLLNLMCQCGHIIAPFTSFPSAFLPLLQKHQINSIIDQLEKQVKKEHRQAKPSFKSAKMHPHLPKTISSHKIQENSSQRNTLAKTLTIDTNITMHKTALKPCINHNSLEQKKKCFRRREHSVLDSIDLFKQTSVSSQVRQFTMGQIKRSQTVDLRAQCSILAFDGVTLNIRNGCPRKEYWQTVVLTSPATPKYLNAMHAGKQEEVIATNRPEDREGCCIENCWG